MGQKISATDIKKGNKVEFEKAPYVVELAQFVKPGKGQAFCKFKIKNLFNGKVRELTVKSHESFELADVDDQELRMLYKDMNNIVFMNDTTYDQIEVPAENFEEIEPWIIEDKIHRLIFYKGKVISIEPPTFLELKIKDTEHGERGDTSGRVLKSATLENDQKVQVPLFINNGDIVKVDTRDYSYSGRVS